METNRFQLFDAPHLLVLASIPAIAVALAWWARSHGSVDRPIRHIFASLIVANELLWYGYLFGKGWVTFPYSLPINLCDLVIWMTVFTCLRPTSRFSELIYYWGLAGSSMALLTPDVSSPLSSYLTIRFFLSHGLTIAAILFLLWSNHLAVQRGSIWRALIWLNVYAIVVGVFNIIFRTNYFFLCEKPGGASLLDYFGPWPWYILAGEAAAVALFALLWIPFLRSPPLHKAS